MVFALFARDLARFKPLLGDCNKIGGLLWAWEDFEGLLFGDPQAWCKHAVLLVGKMKSMAGLPNALL